MWRETTLFDLQVSKYQLQIILESRMKIATFLASEACVDTGKPCETAELWNEIQNLKTLLKQERNLRLSFEQIQLNTLSDLALRVSCNETQVNSNAASVRTLEQRLNTINRTLVSMENGCVSGQFSAWEHPIQPAWPVTQSVTFDPPFEKAPVVTSGMTILDSEYDTNVRAIIEITNITRYGFELILKTFNNTKQWGLKASWMACPAR